MCSSAEYLAEFPRSRISSRFDEDYSVLSNIMLPEKLTPPKTWFRRLIQGLLAIGQCGGDGTVDWDEVFEVAAFSVCPLQRSGGCSGRISPV